MRQNLSLEKVYRELQEQFYVNVPFPLSRAVLEEAMEAFFKFLAEPDNVKGVFNGILAPLLFIAVITGRIFPFADGVGQDPNPVVIYVLI